MHHSAQTLFRDGLEDELNEKMVLLYGVAEDFLETGTPTEAGNGSEGVKNQQPLQGLSQLIECNSLFRNYHVRDQRIGTILHHY